MMTPKEHHGDLAVGAHFTGYGFEFRTRADGSVRTMSKEGINVGVSGELRHYPVQEATVVVLSNLEEGAWEPLRIIDRMIERVDP
jgi:hypothetical protein